MSWQAILDENSIVVTVNNWEHPVGIPCPEDTPIGYFWDGTAFVRSQTDIIRELQEGVQRHLDETVQTRNYDSMLSCCSYATSSVARFALEGQAAVTWRDAVWDACYTILDDCLAGTRPVPTLDALIAELPTIGW